MSVVEAELEREKSDRIRQIAETGSKIAAETGADASAVRTFLAHYFRHVDADDVVERSIEDLMGLVESHYRLAAHRAPVSANVQVLTPTQASDGWSAGGASVVQIITDDRPFLVDSVTMEVLRQGWSIREVFHPQFTVRRDVSGTLQQVVHTREAENDATVLRESWMHLEILPPSTSEVRDSAAVGKLAANLESGLAQVLRHVEDAVEDWGKMQAMARETIAELHSSAPPVPEYEVAAATELMEWLADNHFTFLGYRKYDLVHDGERLEYQPVPASGLGILRADKDAEGSFHALPPAGRRPRLMVITKDNVKATVHRPVYLDYIGIRAFGENGEITGERRFLGLLASTAYSETVSRIPVLRSKAAELLHRAGYDESSHGGKAMLDVLDTYPRDELFQTTVSELAPIVEKVSRLKERRQVRLFVRPDPYGRFMSCLVYLPRDRYTTAVRSRMQDILLESLGGDTIDYTAKVSESVLARLHFVVRMRKGSPLGEVDVRSLERELTRATRSWDDEFVDQLSADTDLSMLSSRVGSLPEGYKEDFTPRQAVMDLDALAQLDGDTAMSLALYAPEVADDEADLRLKIFRTHESISLSWVLPHLSQLGVDVIDERPYELVHGESRSFIYDFGLKVPGGQGSVKSVWTRAARHRFMDAFEASYRGDSESDAFNGLVMGAELAWRQVGVLRAIARYLRQAGTTNSQTYIAQALCANVHIARQLIDLFEAKFNPARAAAGDEAVRDVTDSIKKALDDVSSLDQDRIIRSYLVVINAIVRTNAFRPERQTLALKLLPRKVPFLPEPRPAFEVFVYSPRVEGVHLRFGAVARGGLRWSDRAEDFRTEVLGLVKAQMVKNTVIVPVGAKGGFYCKRLPNPADNREAWLTEGVECYKLFIASLLEITDNIVDHELVPPRQVLRYDGDDAYLVVAADKGTATFSDIANSIAIDTGYWLGDAFASGGSAGYDHKGMGITATGAWESVKRHFRDLGVDGQNEDFTCVGVGDMSGDVFGNGMLLSKHTRLVAAFDHRHVFIDPNPEPATSWQERARLFDLPRSSWADYDASLISEGGGVFPRTVKSITITEQMRTALGLDDDVMALAPTELITAVLKAPVDLFWNGGIGTYVKSSRETNAQVGDKTNDNLRVNGADLRARCVGEGGNLGVTQLGRIEYASKGGLINTDFVDNSAGVDTSDHEVNIKILLAAEVAAGRLSLAERDEMLHAMTDDVANLVLAHNYDQNLTLANALYQAQSMAGVHEDWMQRLVELDYLDRKIEYLPSSQEMKERRSADRGLTCPELATLMAYTKIMLEKEVLKSGLPDDPYLADRLINYFPPLLREKYADQMPKHRLHREIITTVAVNRFVNASGLTCYWRLSEETGAGPADVMRAQLAARAVFRAGYHETAIRRLDNKIDAGVQTGLRMEVRTLVERATRWMLNNRRSPIDVAAAIEQFTDGVQQVKAALPSILSGRDAEEYQQRRQSLLDEDVPEELASATAMLPPVYAALTIVQTAVRDGLDPERVARTHFDLGQKLGLDRLLARIVELNRRDRWQIMARAALRDDLHAVHAQLTAQVLADGEDEAGVGELVAQWWDSHPTVEQSTETLQTICAPRPDLARMSVGLRIVRSLLPQEAA